MSCFQKTEIAHGNIFIRPMVLRVPGDVVEGHKHNFDHVTAFLDGWWLAERLGPDGSAERIVQVAAPEYLLKRVRPRVFQVGNGYVSLTPDQDPPVGATPVPFNALFSHLFIEKGVAHRFTLLDGPSFGSTAWCLYAHRDPQGNVVEKWTGWEDAYR
jgi:hypothetical protein